MDGLEWFALLGEELPEDDDVLGHLKVLQPAGVVEHGLETPGQLHKSWTKMGMQRVHLLAWICQPTSSECIEDYWEEHSMREGETI